MIAFVTENVKDTGLSKGGMYHYFGSKEEIFDGVVRYALEQERPYYEKTLSEAKTVTAKLKAFISSDVLGPSDFISQVSDFKRQEKHSIVPHRIRELNGEFGVPYLEEILRFGIAQGSLYTQYPAEMARFLYLCGESLFYDMMNAPFGKKGETWAERHAAAFARLVASSLNISKEEEAAFAADMRQELLTQMSRRKESADSSFDGI